MGWLMSRIAVYAAMWLAAVAAVVIALVFLLVAVWFAFRNIAPPDLAALWTALSALGAAVLIAAAAYFKRRRRSPVGDILAPLIKFARGGRERDIADALGSLVGRETATLITTHPAGSVVTALAAGFVVGATPELREHLGEILKK